MADAKFPELLKIEGHAQPVTAVAFNADGTQLFTGGADNAIKQWNLADGAEVRTISGHGAAIAAFYANHRLTRSEYLALRKWEESKGDFEQH